ncbi:DUF4234 domain-containing protein [bacterium]|jgi:hypothetical protein|nr:DUF4234 domain-containing protein [bacterium]
MKPEPRNIALDLVLTVFTCMMWNLVVQYGQMNQLNYLLKREKYHFLKFYGLSILTCGIYVFFHEYQKAKDLIELTGSEEDMDTLLALAFTAFGLSIVYDAIAQSKINALLEKA